MLFVLLWPAREGNVAEFDAHGVESAWTLFGTMGGLLVAWWADRRFLNFDTRAVWWAQLAKLAVGLALVMGVRVGLKARWPRSLAPRPSQTACATSLSP